MGEVNQDTILQHQRKRRRHKIKLAVGSFVVILVAIILIATYAILSKNYYNEYKENAEVEYKIRLNENEFYTGEYLEGSTGVVASIIKDIEAEFKYKLDLKEVKTKNMVNALENLKVEGKTLIVLPEKNENVQKSARNIEGVKTSLVNTINVYDLLKYNKLVLTVDAVKSLEEVYA